MRISVLVCFLLTFSLHADIFSLWPFRGSSSTSSQGDNAADILEPQKLWTEKVVINGKNMEMGVALVDHTLRDALRLLRMKYPNAPFAANSSSVLFEVSLPNGFRRRIYLVGFAGKDTIVQFTMDVPPDLPETKIPWPAELPLPPGASPVTVMRFPARNSVYGTFRSPYSDKQVLADLVKALRADGWESTGETKSSSASGDVFLRKDGSEMMILGTVMRGEEPSSSRGSRGTLYFRRLK